MTDSALTQTGVGVARDDRGRYFAFSLSPRASRTHLVCRPLGLSIRRPVESKPFKTCATDGARYTVTDQRVLQER